MGSLGGILVQRESASILPLHKPLSCSIISFKKKKQSLTVNSLIVRQLSAELNTFELWR